MYNVVYSTLSYYLIDLMLVMSYCA